MYGQENIFRVRPEDILAVTSEESIFKIVLEDVVLDKVKKYTAPYRDDSIPKCYFERGRNGALHFVDFADTVIRKDCFGFIGACYNLDFIETLYFIDKKLNLGISKGNTAATDIPIVVRSTKKYTSTKSKTSIDIAPREFQKRDRDFWWSYGISRLNLTSDGVMPISCYRLTNKDGKKFTFSPNDICYAYTEFDNSRKKIYRPTGSPIEKWLTTCNQDDIGGIRHIDYSCDYLVITKSYKDYRVLKNEGANVIWFQNEGMIPSVDTLNRHKILLFKKIYIWFDNDPPGIAGAMKVKEYLQSLEHRDIELIIIPAPYLRNHGVKDPSDFRKYDSKKFTNFIHTKISQLCVQSK